MPTLKMIMSLWIVALLAANVILIWVTGETRRAGIWPTETIFGIPRARPWKLFHVVRELKHRIEHAEDASESRPYRIWLLALYLGNGLGLLAVAGFLVSAFLGAN